MLKNKDFLSFLAFKLSDVLFIMVMIVKMPTIVGILTFMSMINFVVSWVELENSFLIFIIDIKKKKKKKKNGIIDIRILKYGIYD